MKVTPNFYSGGRWHERDAEEQGPPRSSWRALEHEGGGWGGGGVWGRFCP